MPGSLSTTQGRHRSAIGPQFKRHTGDTQRASESIHGAERDGLAPAERWFASRRPAGRKTGRRGQCLGYATRCNDRLAMAGQLSCQLPACCGGHRPRAAHCRRADGGSNRRTGSGPATDDRRGRPASNPVLAKSAGAFGYGRREHSTGRTRGDQDHWNRTR
jgi:hypothetical protein